jgi:hypothetical protein
MKNSRTCTFREIFKKFFMNFFMKFLWESFLWERTHLSQIISSVKLQSSFFYSLLRKPVKQGGKLLFPLPGFNLQSTHSHFHPQICGNLLSAWYTQIKFRENFIKKLVTPSRKKAIFEQFPITAAKSKYLQFYVFCLRRKSFSIQVESEEQFLSEFVEWQLA